MSLDGINANQQNDYSMILLKVQKSDGGTTICTNK